MEQEEAELKRTHSKALKDRDALWSKIKTHLLEKRKRSTEDEILFFEKNNDEEKGWTEKLLKQETKAKVSKQPQTSTKDCTKSFVNEYKKELTQETERIESGMSSTEQVDDWCILFESSGGDNYCCCDLSEDGLSYTPRQNEYDDSFDLMEIFDNNEDFSQLSAPTESETSDRGSNISSYEDDLFWEQEQKANFAGFSSVEKQNSQHPKPSSSFPIFIQHKKDWPPSPADSTPTYTERDPQTFCQGLVVDDQYKDTTNSDRASSFAVPKKRITFL